MASDAQPPGFDLVCDAVSCEYTNELGGVESFDVYVGPFTSLYSQVWWAPLAPIPLGDLTKKYDGKKVVIVGWEIDQVRKTAAGDVSVPITASYNHHYGKADRFPTHA